MTSQAQFHCHATVLISANPTFTMTAYYLSWGGEVKCQWWQLFWIQQWQAWAGKHSDQTSSREAM
jgi:hypothetical protein